MSAKRGVALLSIGNLAVPLAAFLSAPLLARALTVEERGDVAAATATAQLAIALFSVGLQDATTFFSARLNGRSKHLIRRSLLLGALLGTLATVSTILAAPLVSGGSPRVEALIVAAAFACLPAMLAMAVRGWAVGEQRWGASMVDGLVGPVARLLVLVILVSFGMLSALAGVIAIMLTGFVGVLVYLRPLRRSVAPDSTDEDVPAMSLARYGAGVWIGSVGGVVLSLLDQVLMPTLSTSYQLGIYAVAVSISQIVLVANNSIRSVFLSLESRSPDIGRLARVARISTLLTVTACAAIALIVPWGLPFLFGAEYSGAIVVVQILLLSTVLGNAGSVAGVGLMARGKPILRSLSMLTACVVNVVLILILVPPYGAIGAAWATVAAGLVAGNMNILLLRAFVGVQARNFYGVRRGDVADLKRLSIEVVRVARKRGERGGSSAGETGSE
ncbi:MULTISPECIES: lipopolysaccharide biosynthesis protein [Microbacterium]|nr:MULTISPECIES: oligosaccharide flippase family protein [Microbacterium]